MRKGTMQVWGRATCLAGALFAGGVWAGEGSRNRVAVLRDEAAGVDAATAEAVAQALRSEMFEVVFLSAAEAGDPAALAPDKFFLYALPNPAAYPASATNALARYLNGKGSLLVLGTPRFPGKTLLETVSPAYKQFALSDIASLDVCGGQGLLPDVRLPAPKSMASCYARPEGKGAAKGYKWRWIPLAKAHDASGAERGTPVWMLVHQKPLAEGAAFEDAVRRLVGNNNTADVPLGAEGSVFAVCAVSDPQALQAIARTGLIGRMARRIADGVFLSHAGADEFAYWPGEKVGLGAEVANTGDREATLSVRLRVCRKDNGQVAHESESKVAVAPGKTAAVSSAWSPERFECPAYTVVSEVLREGAVIDRIEHEIGVLSDAKAADDEFVSVKGGGFLLKGKPWVPVGVNYWPRHSIALEQEDYVYHWLTPGFYNPEEVEGDLALLEKMGATFVAIRAHHENDRRTLLDFLRRCRNHGIVAMVFLQSHVITDDPHYFQGIMTPFHYQAEAVRDFMKATRIAENPALLCWDLIWEPAGWVFGDKITSFGWTDPAPYRQRWDAQWAKWVDERYGSLANAESDWGMPAPRAADGSVTSPSSKQLSSDGPWRVMVCAYRRFMADLMNRFWNDAAGEIRALDPRHLITYRQGNLSMFDFTLTSTLKHVDFFAMEGYDFKPRIATNAADVAGFVNRYLSFAMGGKPFMWVEYGHSAWDGKAMEVGTEPLAYQADCVDLINRMAYENGASGLAPWWMAGGYRISEKSDFGVFNPDGTLRPSGESLKKYIGLLKTSPRAPQPAAPVVIDNDAHCGGVAHVARHEGAEAFARAAAEGKWLEVRTAGTGTTSADTPLVAVGNTPYNGKNPPKYLDAEFNAVKISVSGEWSSVTNGARVSVPKGTCVFAAASVGNLQEATWLTPDSCGGKPGAVWLASTDASAVSVRAALSRDTPYQQDAEFGETFVLANRVERETAVELQMTVDGRIGFGEKFRLTLVPR